VYVSVGLESGRELPGNGGSNVMVKRFYDDEEGYHDWAAVNPRGYTLNCYKSKSTGPYMLHRADCHTLRNTKNLTTGQYYKVCSNDKEELTEWVKQSYGSGFRFDRCKKCSPYAP
jgi:hypothetical protein